MSDPNGSPKYAPDFVKKDLIALCRRQSAALRDVIDLLSRGEAQSALAVARAVTVAPLPTTRSQPSTVAYSGPNAPRGRALSHSEMAALLAFDVWSVT